MGRRGAVVMMKVGRKGEGRVVGVVLLLVVMVRLGAVLDVYA